VQTGRKAEVLARVGHALAVTLLAVSLVTAAAIAVPMMAERGASLATGWAESWNANAGR
jgi:thymidine phosphorylase